MIPRKKELSEPDLLEKARTPYACVAFRINWIEGDAVSVTAEIKTTDGRIIQTEPARLYESDIFAWTGLGIEDSIP